MCSIPYRTSFFLSLGMCTQLVHALFFPKNCLPVKLTSRQFGLSPEEKYQEQAIFENGNQWKSNSKGTMLGFVMKPMHTQDSTESTAEQHPCEQNRFRNAPLMPLGFSFIQSHCTICDQVDQQQVHQTDFCKPSHALLFGLCFGFCL